MHELLGIIFVILLWTFGVIPGSYLAVFLFAVMMLASFRNKDRRRFNPDDWRRPETAAELHEGYAAALAEIADMKDQNETLCRTIDEMRNDFENAYAEMEQELDEVGTTARRALLDLHDRDRADFDALLRARRTEREFPYPGWHRRDPSPDHWNDETPWWTVFGVLPTANKPQVKAAYHDLVRRYHPDNRETGHVDWIKKINIAWEQVKA